MPQSDDQKSPLEYHSQRSDPPRDQLSGWAVASFIFGMLIFLPCTLTVVGAAVRFDAPSIPSYIVLIVAGAAAVCGFGALLSSAYLARGQVRGLWMAWFGLITGIIILSVRLMVALFSIGLR